MPDWLEVILRTLVAIVVLFFMTKILGKRQLSQLSLFEYITGISIGNLAAYVSLDLDNLWFLGLVSIAVWVAVSASMEFWTIKNRRVKNFVDGKGTVLIKDGQLIRENLKKEKLTVDELLSQLRQKDVFAIADVEFAVMESSGVINAMLKKEHQPLTGDMLGWKMSSEQPPQTVIMDGIMLDGPLGIAGYSKEWLDYQLDQYKVNMENVLIAQIDTDGQLNIKTADGKTYPEDQKVRPQKKIQQLTHQLELELERLGQFARNDSDRLQYEAALNKVRSMSKSKL